MVAYIRCKQCEQIADEYEPHYPKHGPYCGHCRTKEERDEIEHSSGRKKKRRREGAGSRMNLRVIATLLLVPLASSADPTLYSHGALAGDADAYTVGQCLMATTTTKAVFGVLPIAGGGTGLAGAADNTTLISSGSAWAAKAFPDCTATSAALGYTDSSNTLDCHTISGVSLTASVTGTLPVANGGTNLTAAADDNVMVGNGTTWQTKAVADCNSDTTRAVQYDTATNAFSCAVITASAAPAGSDAQLQYNNGGALGGTNAFGWDDAAEMLFSHDDFICRLDNNDDAVGDEFLIQDGDGNQMFSFNEDGEAEIANLTMAYRTGGWRGMDLTPVITTTETNPAVYGVVAGPQITYSATLSMGFNAIMGFWATPAMVSTAFGSGTETASAIYGLLSQPSFDGTLGPRTGTSITGVAGQYTVSGGTITNAYSFFANASNAGTVTNAYGLYIGDMLGTADWGIYQAASSDDSYFAGRVGIGQATLTTGTKVQVDGGYLQIEDIYYNSGSSPDAADCDTAAEWGRIRIFDQIAASADGLCICVETDDAPTQTWGWKCETFT